ncbi:Hypothetical predicted protein [Mytilus galloprovincialis]|uniref:Uncharacterized protein n=1 Tax=Mytilus galloprovincialis TaxID=29158 RepID=A0A8B6GUC9_MYTGA|nr:Hypothetical predicted protein [Mytilus galloprovincialis]
MTAGTKKSTTATTTLSSTLYTTLTTSASMTSTTDACPCPALSKSTFIDADIDVVIVTSATISLLYYFTKYRKSIFTFCRNLRRRTWYSGSHYSQYNTQEGDEQGTKK